MKLLWWSRNVLMATSTLLIVLQAVHLATAADEKRFIDLNALPYDEDEVHSPDMEYEPNKDTVDIRDPYAHRKRRSSIEYKSRKQRLKRIKEAPPGEKVVLYRKGRHHLTNREYLDAERTNRNEMARRYLSDPERRRKVNDQRKAWYAKNRGRVLEQHKQRRIAGAKKRESKTSTEGNGDQDVKLMKRADVPRHMIDLNSSPQPEDSDPQPARPHSVESVDPNLARRKRRSEQVSEARKNRYKRAREGPPDDKVVLLRAPDNPNRPSNEEYLARIRQVDAKRQARNRLKPGAAEDKRRRNRLYYARNKEKVKERVHNNYLENKQKEGMMEAKRERDRRYYRSNKSSKLSQVRQYRKENREKVLEQQRGYRRKKRLQKNDAGVSSQELAAGIAKRDTGPIKVFVKRSTGPSEPATSSSRHPASQSAPPLADSDSGGKSLMDLAHVARKAQITETKRKARLARKERARTNPPDEPMVFLKGGSENSETNAEWLQRLRQSNTDSEKKRRRLPHVMEAKKQRDRVYYKNNAAMVRERMRKYYDEHRTEIQALRKEKRLQKKLEAKGEAGRKGTKTSKIKDSASSTNSAGLMKRAADNDEKPDSIASTTSSSGSDPLMSLARAAHRVHDAENHRKSRYARLKRARESKPDEPMQWLRKHADMDLTMTNKEFLERERVKMVDKRAKRRRLPEVREGDRERGRRYYRAHSDEIKERRKAHFVKNRHAILERKRERRDERREEVRKKALSDANTAIGAALGTFKKKGKGADASVGQHSRSSAQSPSRS